MKNFRTSYLLDDRVQRMPDIDFNTKKKATKSKKNLEIIFDKRVKFQELLGFGGAITEAAAITFSGLPEALQEIILERYFGDGEESNKYSIGRLSINSCDFSTGNWSSDDVVDDFTLSKFSLSDHDTETIIPLVQKILKYKKDLKLFGSSWSPPAWFKKNGQMVETTFPNGLKDDEKYWTTWANYISKWVKAYEEKLGVELFAVTTQNEPLGGHKWEDCAYSPKGLQKFTKMLINSFKKNKLDTEIIIFDDRKNELMNYVPVILEDEYVKENINWVGFHWYHCIGESKDLEELHKAFPKLKFLPTEACHDHGVRFNNVSRGEDYASDIIADLNAWSAGWVDWNILLNGLGGPNHLGNVCDSPILGIKNKEILLQPMFFYMGHFSRFIPPKSRRIYHKTNNVKTNLEFTSWISPKDEVVLVVMNRSEKDENFSIVDAEDNRTAEIEIPRRSIYTFIV